VVATVVLASEVLATVEDDEVELAAEAAVLVVVAWVVVASPSFVGDPVGTAVNISKVVTHIASELHPPLLTGVVTVIFPS